MIRNSNSNSIDSNEEKIDDDLIKMIDTNINKFKMMDDTIEMLGRLDQLGYDTDKVKNALDNQYSDHVNISVAGKSILIEKSTVQKIDEKSEEEQDRFRTHAGDNDKTEEELQSNKNIGGRAEAALTYISMVSDEYDMLPTRDIRGKNYNKYDFVNSDGTTYDLKCTRGSSNGTNIVYLKDNQFDMRSKNNNYNRDDFQNVSKFQQKVRNKPDRVEFVINSHHIEFDNHILIVFTSIISTQDIADNLDDHNYQSDMDMWIYPQYKSGGDKNRTIYLLSDFVWRTGIAERV